MAMVFFVFVSIFNFFALSHLVLFSFNGAIRTPATLFQRDRNFILKFSQETYIKATILVCFFKLNILTFSLETASPCYSAPCLNGGSCTANKKVATTDYKCICSIGFTGNNCERKGMFTIFSVSRLEMGGGGEGGSVRPNKLLQNLQTLQSYILHISSTASLKYIIRFWRVGHISQLR